MFAPYPEADLRTAEYRVLWPLVRFGLLEARAEPEPPPSHTSLTYVRKTDLFDRLITFDLDIEFPGVAR